MRSIVLAVVLSACGGGGGGGGPVDVHAFVTCDHAWVANGFNQCEAACAASAPALGAMGPSCQAMTTNGDPVDCSKTFVFQGVTGCCAADPPRVLFAECS